MKKISKQDRENIRRGLSYLSRVDVPVVQAVVAEAKSRIEALLRYNPDPDNVAVRDGLIYERKPNGRIDVYYVPEVRK